MVEERSQAVPMDQQSAFFSLQVPIRWSCEQLRGISTDIPSGCIMSSSELLFELLDGCCMKI